MRNSAQFATFIAGQVLPSGMVLVLYDVISLFTNVPVDLAVKVANERLSTDTSLAERTALSADQVKVGGHGRCGEECIIHLSTTISFPEKVYG